MKEIVELNHRLAKLEAFSGVLKSTEVPTRGALPRVLEGLPYAIRMELDILRQRLSMVIPTDFSGSLFFGEDCGLALEFSDGAQTVVNCPMEWDPVRSVFEQFEAVDWNSVRKDAMRRSQQFEQMIERGMHKPPTVPSTKELQRIFHEPMQEFVKLTRSDATKVHVMIFRQDRVEGEKVDFVRMEFENLGVYAKELINLLPWDNWVVAVVANGKPMPVKRIDELKQAALAELKKHMPISYIKAIGTYEAEPEWMSLGGVLPEGSKF